MGSTAVSANISVSGQSDSESRNPNAVVADMEGVRDTPGLSFTVLIFITAVAVVLFNNAFSCSSDEWDSGGVDVDK